LRTRFDEVAVDGFDQLRLILHHFDRPKRVGGAAGPAVEFLAQTSVD